MRFRVLKLSACCGHKVVYAEGTMVKLYHPGSIMSDKDLETYCNLRPGGKKYEVFKRPLEFTSYVIQRDTGGYIVAPIHLIQGV